MFTGIIETTAKILSLDPQKGTLVMQRPPMFDDIQEGSSISVSGACLSVTAFDEHTMQFDVVPETFARTKFGSLTVGDSVNLERAMKATDRFEGHIVQGHVEGVGKIVGVRNVQTGRVITITLPSKIERFVVEKGSIAIDGTSLTVSKKDEGNCSIALIPLTLEHTTLGSVRVGGKVNVETDLLGKYVARMMLANAKH